MVRTRAGRGRRAGLACVGLSAVGALLLPGSTAGAAVDDEPSGRSGHRDVVTTTEEGCVEVLFPRPGTEQLLEEVPDRYTVRRNPLSGVPQTYLYDYLCTAISVDGHRRAKPTVVSIGAARLAGTTDLYLLWYGTSDPVLAARYRQLGLPTRYVPKSAATVSTTDAGTTAAFDVVGGGLDHTAQAGPVVTTSPTGVVRPGVTFRHDGPRGRLELRSWIDVGSFLTTRPTSDWTRLSPDLRRLLLLPIPAEPLAFVGRLDSRTELRLLDGTARP